MENTCKFEILFLTLRQIISKAPKMINNFINITSLKSMAMAMDMMVMCMMDNQCAALRML